MNLKLFNNADIHKTLIKLMICLFFVWITGIMAGCCVIDPRPIHLNETTRQEVIISTSVGDTFPIYVSLPKDYDNNPGTYYDVVYLLDGEWYFSETQTLIYNHVENNEIKPVILVGIGNTAQRGRDYTPTFMEQYPNSGGGQKYENFIKTELIPYIDSHYRTIPNPENRCLAGHSLGGLFAYYALFFCNDTFHKIIAASSTLMWDNSIIFHYEENYVSTHTELPVMFYTSVCTGDYSINPYQNEMVNKLRSRNYSGFTLIVNSFEGEGHVYSWKPALENGLFQFYKK